MHVQIVKFNLESLEAGDYEQLCRELAPAFAEVAGLRAKTWLADPASNTFGGVYVWEDRESMETFTTSDLWRSVGDHPNLTAITSEDFDVLEAPTRVTRGAFQIA